MSLPTRQNKDNCFSRNGSERTLVQQPEHSEKLQLTECVAMETQSGVSTTIINFQAENNPARLAGGIISSSSRETFFPPRVHVNL